MTENTGFRSGFAALVGRPNVGKSTLLNALLGEKVSIVSSHAQTTRNKITGVWNGDNAQVVFLDTPGMHKPQSKLGEAIRQSTIGCLRRSRSHRLPLRHRRSGRSRRQIHPLPSGEQEGAGHPRPFQD